MPGLRAAIDALRSTPLRRALVVFLAFGVGREAIWLVLLLYAYDAGGAAAVAAIAVAQLLPATLLAPLTATWLDRLTAQRGLVLAYGCSAAGALAIGVALLAGAPVWVVVTVAVAQSVAVTLVRPAHFAVLPRIADLPSRLVAANAASGSVDALGVLLGPVAVAVALGLGQTPAVVVGLALLLASGAVVLAVTSAGTPGMRAGTGRRQPRRWARRRLSWRQQREVLARSDAFLAPSACSSCWVSPGWSRAPWTCWG